MEEPVRVTFVSPHAVLGGAEAVLETLIRALGSPWRAGVVVLQDGPLVDRLRDAGVAVEVVPTGRRAGMVLAAFRLRRVLARQRPDVVHANGIKAALVGALAVAGRSERLLWMKHDTAGDPGLSRVIGRFADLVVGVSDTVLRPFDGTGVPRRTIHNGVPERTVDRDAGRRLVARALDVDEHTPVVALVGRLCVGKGQSELIAAASGVLERHPGARFALVGGDDPAFPGHRRRLTAEAAALGIADRVHLTGRREDVPEFLSGCDVLVVPSIEDPVHGWREGFGLVPVEALQAGTPVVGYASGALPEVLAGAARLVAEGDRQALGVAIADALDGGVAVAARVAEGRARVADLYSRDRSVDALRTALGMLAGSGVKGHEGEMMGTAVSGPAAWRRRATRLGVRRALKAGAGALGFDLVKKSFYSPLPDWRAMPDEVWTRRSELLGIDWDQESQLRLLEQELAPYLAEFRPPREPAPGPAAYSYGNGFFGAVDGDTLYAMIRHLRPPRVVELGSGYSSPVIAQARRRNAEEHPDAAAGEHVVWDPFSRPELRGVIAAQADLRLVSANDVPMEHFETLAAGDVLFVDTTHTVKLDSDVNHVILDVLPRLQSGVVVHFHDIFLPYEYPKEWFTDPEVYWAEQYLLQAFLSGNESWEVLLANAALLADEPERVRAVIPSAPLHRAASSFWMRRR